MTESNSYQAGENDLGREVYGERRHINPAVTYTSLGAVFLVVGLLCSLLRPPPPSPPHSMLIMGLVVAAFGAVCLAIGLVRLIPNLGASWHLHEHGIRLVQGGKEQVLRYETVDQLTVKVTRVFMHGVCTGEVHEVTFKARQPREKTLRIKQVRRSKTASGADLDERSELAQVCDNVAGLIAQRMAAEIEHGKPVEWIPDVRLRPDGLELGSSRGTPERIAWSEIDRVAIEDGKCQLWARRETVLIIKLPTHLPNFFPGYRVVLERI